MYRNYSGRAVVCFMDGSYKLMFKETCLDCMDISFTICIRIPILRTLFIFIIMNIKGGLVIIQYYCIQYMSEDIFL